MIKENLAKVKSSIPTHVELIAVSKTKPLELLEEAYAAGQRHFGENRVQELEEKYNTLPKDIKWHMIGHLQSKKVKAIASFVHLIHAVDSLKLLQVINKEALKHNRIISCLIQFHIAKEDSKYGFAMNEVKSLLDSSEFKSLANVSISGVMGMATFTDNKEQVRNEFKTLKNNFTELKETYFNADDNFNTISMGMSGDYEIAIEEGSTMVRVGSSIFGSRN